jgi:hypothetical protein
MALQQEHSRRVVITLIELLRRYHNAQLWLGKLWFSDDLAVVYVSRRLVNQRGKLPLFNLQPWVCEATSVTHRGVGLYIAIWPYVADRDAQAQQEQNNKQLLPEAYILDIKDDRMATVLLSTGEQFDTKLDPVLLANVDRQSLPYYVGEVVVDLESGVVSGYVQNDGEDNNETTT